MPILDMLLLKVTNLIVGIKAAKPFLDTTSVLALIMPLQDMLL